MLTHWHGQSQILGLSPHKKWDSLPVHKSGLNLTCDAFGILKEYRKRKAYRKPSARIKEKREAAEKRRKKEANRLRIGA